MKLQIAKLAATVETLAFNLASDLVESCVYVQPADAKYDPETGEQGSINDPATFVTADVSAMILQFSEKEIDNQTIRFGDERVLIRAVDLGAILPAEDDYMTNAAGKKRQVIAIKADATRTLYTFQMRTVEQLAGNDVLTTDAGDPLVTNGNDQLLAA